MSRFTTPLLISAHPEGREWTLEEGLVYKTGGMTLVVPKGATTDFASTPRILWSVFPPFGRYNKAAVLHDHIYRTPSLDISRARADAIFLEAMITCRVPGFKRLVMYWAVRLFGGFSYQRRKPITTNIKA